MSRTFLYSCTCGAQMPVADTQAGRSTACPACQAAIVLPTMKEIRRLPPAPDQVTTQTAEWGGGRGLVFALGVFLILVSLLAAGVMLYQRLQLNASFSIEKDLAAGEEAINKAGRLESFHAFTIYRREGLGPQLGLQYLVEQENARILEWGMAIALGLAALGALLCAGTLLGRRSQVT